MNIEEEIEKKKKGEKLFLHTKMRCWAISDSRDKCFHQLQSSEIISTVLSSGFEFHHHLSGDRPLRPSRHVRTFVYFPDLPLTIVMTVLSGAERERRKFGGGRRRREKNLQLELFRYFFGQFQTVFFVYPSQHSSSVNLSKCSTSLMKALRLCLSISNQSFSERSGPGLPNM